MLYGTIYGSHWFLELGAAGVMNWFENDRNISFPGFNAVAKSLYKGWQAVPHFAIGRDFDFDWGALEPFAAVDCAILYHEGYDETGAGALNMSVRGAYSYFLRSEAGLNAYQVLHRDWGYITLRETASYVNRQGFEVGKTKASLVGFPSGFTVTSFTDNQSLFSPAFEIFFKGNSGLFLSGTYHGEFGSGYRTHEALGKIGLFF